MVAALRDFQIGIVRWRQFQPGTGQGDAFGKAGRRCPFHRLHHACIVLRAGDRGKVWEAVADEGLFLAHTARHDDRTARGLRLSNGIKAFLPGRVQKGAGIDDHRIGGGIVADAAIAVSAQLGQNPLGIDKGLWAAQRDHADRARCSRSRHHARPLMTKHPYAGKGHGDACRIGGGDHLGVTDRAAGLDDGRRARLNRL